MAGRDLSQLLPSTPTFASDCIDCRRAHLHAFAHSRDADRILGPVCPTRELLPDGCDDLVLISPVEVRSRLRREKTVELEPQACLIEMMPLLVLSSTILAALRRRGSETFLLQVAPNAEARLYQPLGENLAAITMVERYFALC